MDCSVHMSDWRSRARVEPRRFEEETWRRPGSDTTWAVVVRSFGPSSMKPDDAAYLLAKVCATSSLGTPDWLSWARGVRRAAGRPCWWGRWFLSQVR